MSYRVEELAAAGGVSVDTVRYYQGLGLLDPPRREGRVGFYDDRHRYRLSRIRSLADSGFTLRQIRDLLERDGSEGHDPLLEALDHQRRSRPTLSIADLSEITGVKAEILQLAVGAGLLRPASSGDGEHFDEEQAAMVETFGRLLASGMDLEPLIELATSHAAHVDVLVRNAVSLYRDAVDGDGHIDRSRVAREIQALVPAVTRLIADHFSRSIVEHAAELVDES